ncbi:MAG TPA: hypothetical protein VFX49_05590 [Chloroflexota bacterium]|nr:hypothetical protein [Chloroflexota bacterium]
MSVSEAPALSALRRRDELLSLLYWLHADQLNDTPTATDLEVFAGPHESLDDDLRTLAAAGLVSLDAPPSIHLTAAGLLEGMRRFEEDFGSSPIPGVAGNAHEVMVGVCGPNARCVRDGSHGECAEPVLPTVISPDA